MWGALVPVFCPAWQPTVSRSKHLSSSYVHLSIFLSPHRMRRIGYCTNTTELEIFEKKLDRGGSIDFFWFKANFRNTFFLLWCVTRALGHISAVVSFLAARWCVWIMHVALFAMFFVGFCVGFCSDGIGLVDGLHRDGLGMCSRWRADYIGIVLRWHTYFVHLTLAQHVHCSMWDATRPTFYTGAHESIFTRNWRPYIWHWLLMQSIVHLHAEEFEY